MIPLPEKQSIGLNFVSSTTKPPASGLGKQPGTQVGLFKTEAKPIAWEEISAELA